MITKLMIAMEEKGGGNFVVQNIGDWVGETSGSWSSFYNDGNLSERIKCRSFSGSEHAASNRTTTAFMAAPRYKLTQITVEIHIQLDHSILYLIEVACALSFFSFPKSSRYYCNSSITFRTQVQSRKGSALFPCWRRNFLRVPACLVHWLEISVAAEWRERERERERESEPMIEIGYT